MTTQFLRVNQHQEGMEKFGTLINDLSSLIKVDLVQVSSSAIELIWEEKKASIFLDTENYGDTYQDDFRETYPVNIVLSMSLGVIGQGAESNIYPALLEGNLFWSATNGATIGVNSETREATLSKSYNSEGLNAQQMIEHIELIHKTVCSWSLFIAEKNQEVALDNSGHSMAQGFLKV